MKIAHFSTFGPNRCGLYHTAKELVLAERLEGIDARMIAFGEKYEGRNTDGDFETEGVEWGYKADVLVRHSAIPTHLQCAGIPIVMAMHGRPESSARLDAVGSNKVIQAFYNKVRDKRHKAFIVFWEEYLDIWSSIVPRDKLFYVPASVDMDEYRPENRPVELNGRGEFNVLICDIWRDDITPFNILFAAADFARNNKGVKIHICGVPQEYIKTMLPFFAGLRKEGLLGHISGQTKDIKGFYTACDVLATPHVIATRSIREALASGLKVVAGSGCRYTPFTANPMDVKSFSAAIKKCYQSNGESISPRRVAEREFSLHNMGSAAKDVFTKILNRPVPKQRKVLIDIGAHIGETTRRFYRQVEEADSYEIYCFEPEPKTFTELDRNIGHIKNVTMLNVMAGTKDGMADFFVGSFNQNEGGTSLKGKFTGGIDYTKPVKVESVNFADWIRANINKGDYAILKMNIEGGEYEIMKLLLDEDLTGMFEKAYIQLHSHKFEMGEQKWRYQEIESEFYHKAKCKVFMRNKGFYDFDE